MGNPGDILDEFDDDSLRSSIEAADKAGQWRDADAKFVDPKLQALARRLAETPRNTYTERRLLELDRRAAEKAAKTSAARKGAFAPPPEEPTTGTAAADWRGTVVRPEAAPPPVVGAAAGTATAAARSRTAAWAGTLGAAVVVFGAGLATQAAFADFTVELGVRGALAALVTGCCWQLFGGGRFRDAAIGTSAHLIAFVSTGSAETAAELFATFLGTLVVLLGSGAVGMMREEETAHAVDAG